MRGLARVGRYERAGVSGPAWRRVGSLTWPAGWRGAGAGQWPVFDAERDSNDPTGATMQFLNEDPSGVSG
jgi:hypothetical protein